MTRRSTWSDEALYSVQHVLEEGAGRSIDWDHPELQRTPERYLNMMRELLHPNDDWDFTTFESDHDEMIVSGPIQLYSLCAHHIIPFFGEVYIGYVPDGRIAGLSKLARVVKSQMRGLWNQEDLSNAIADFLEHRLEPKGVAVVVKAEHLCMSMRGVQSPGTKTTTSIMRGVFSEHDRLARTEFLEFIREAN